MRPGEAICVAAFLCFIVLSLVRQVRRPQQHQILGLGLLGSAAVLLVHAVRLRRAATANIISDWLPSILLLMVYWQSGRFARTPNQKLQRWLEQFDAQRLGTLITGWERHWSTTWIGSYFELAYLFCYALIPLGVAVLYCTHQRALIDRYWLTILAPTILCYLVIPFAPTIPPRLLKVCKQCPPQAIRSMNLFILRHASIQLNTFPSAHVASTVAASLVLLQAAPVVGAAFLLVSLSIAAGAVLGRYHYMPDVVLGALIALAMYLLSLQF
jgi:hypothetical protein